MKYTPDFGREIVQLFKNNGYNCELIGSLSQNKDSDHDIDILMDNFDKRKLYELCDKLRGVLNPKRIEYTDMDSLYFVETKYGDIDLFLDKSMLD